MYWVYGYTLDGNRYTVNIENAQAIDIAPLLTESGENIEDQFGHAIYQIAAYFDTGIRYIGFPYAEDSLDIAIKDLEAFLARLKTQEVRFGYKYK